MLQRSTCGFKLSDSISYAFTRLTLLPFIVFCTIKHVLLLAFGNYHKINLQSDKYRDCIYTRCTQMYTWLQFYNLLTNDYITVDDSNNNQLRVLIFKTFCAYSNI